MDKNNIMCLKMPIGKQLNVLSKLYFGALTHKLEHLEIERYFSILILIENSGNKCTQQYIADCMEVDKTAMVRIIDYLVKKDFIKRVMNPDDRREYWVQLTQKALKKMKEINRAVQTMNTATTKNFSKTELTIFYKILEKMQANLIEMPANKVFVKAYVHEKFKKQVKK
ncbi:MAG: MarR family transcriptional regulator [Bacteroidia bacterium]